MYSYSQIRRTISNACGHIFEAAKVIAPDFYSLKDMTADDRGKQVEWLLEKERYNCPEAGMEVSMHSTR